MKRHNLAALTRALHAIKMVYLIIPPKCKLITGNTRTPRKIVRKMVAKIPKWLIRRGGKFLDPCCGRGTYLLKIIRLLLKNGHLPESVAGMIYGVDSDKYAVYNTRKLIAEVLGIDISKLEHSIVECDFTSWSTKIEFDFIIGNPPYQDGDRKDAANKLWPHFIKKASTILKDGGFLVMITPNGWMSPTADIGKGTSKNAISIFNDVFKKGNLLYANIDNDYLRTFFPEVGSTFSYFVFQNSKYCKKTEFIVKSGSIDIDISNISGLPSDTSNLPITLSIVNKMVGTPFDFIDQNHGLCGKTQDDEDSIHKHKVFHTKAHGGRYAYGTKQHPYEMSPKVIICTSGLYTPFVNNTEGFSDMNIALICKTADEALNAKSILSSKLYTFWEKMQHFSGFVARHLVLKLPAVPLHKLWTDEELYTHFGLTQEEIDYIENTVK